MVAESSRSPPAAAAIGTVTASPGEPARVRPVFDDHRRSSPRSTRRGCDPNSRPRNPSSASNWRTRDSTGGAGSGPVPSSMISSGLATVPRTRAPRNSWPMSIREPSAEPSRIQRGSRLPVRARAASIASASGCAMRATPPGPTRTANAESVSAAPVSDQVSCAPPAGSSGSSSGSIGSAGSSGGPDPTPPMTYACTSRASGRSVPDDGIGTGSTDSPISRWSGSPSTPSVTSGTRSSRTSSRPAAPLG